jgi:capsular exopolysaccharide synthesis family protein
MARDLETTTAGTPEPAPEPSWPNLLQVAWRHKWLILFGTTVGAVLGGLYYLRSPSIYQSSAQIHIMRKYAEAVQLSGFMPDRQEDYVSTQVIVLRSPLIVNQAVEEGGLRSLDSLQGGDAKSLVAQGLAVNRNNTGDNILDLSYSGLNSRDCHVVLKAVIDSYEKYVRENYRNANERAFEDITRKADALKREIDNRQQEYRDFLEKNPLVRKVEDGKSHYGEELSEVQKELRSLRNQRTELERRLVELRDALTKDTDRNVLLARIALWSRLPESTGGKPNRTEAEKLEEKLLPLVLEEQDLLQKFGPDHADVKAVRKRIEAVRGFAARALNASSSESPTRPDGAAADPVSAYLQNVELELQDVKAREALREKEHNDAYQVAKQARNFEADDERLRGDIARDKIFHERLLEQLKGIDLGNDLGGYTVRVLSQPGAGVKIRPRPVPIFIVAVLLGTLGGFGLTLLAELLDKSFRTPDEIRHRLGLPVVGHIPVLVPSGRPLAETLTSGPRLDPHIYTYHKPRSLEAEAYRGVRTALYFGTHGEGRKVIQVTSPQLGDGKTTLIANLSVAIAQSGKRILLVDADLRRPCVHRVFGLSPEQGLTSVLTGESEVQDAIVESGVEGLDVLCCGPVPPNPAELLSSSRFTELLAVLQEQYDYVLIDTPPLLAVTDPSVVAPHVDGVLLTFRLTRQARPHAERAREILQTLGAPILGVVVNAVDQSGGAASYHYGSYKYGYGYGYQYGYGDGQEQDKADHETTVNLGKPTSFDMNVTGDEAARQQNESK